MPEDINSPPKKLDLRFDEWLFRFWAKYQVVQSITNAIAALGNGIIAKTGTGSFAVREIEGTTNQITIANGNGVSANPVVSLPSAIVTPGSLTTTTNLTVDGASILGNGSDKTTINGSFEFNAQATDGTFSVGGNTTATNGIGFLFGTLNYNNTTAAAYQIFSAADVQVAKTNYRVVSIRPDSPLTNTGLISTVAGLDIANNGGSWLGTLPTNYRPIIINNTTLGATNIQGVYNDMVLGTGKWGYFGVGTAPNYFEGRTSIGTQANTDANFRIDKNITGATTAYSYLNLGTVQSDVTSQGIGIRSSLRTQAASFVLANMYLYDTSQGTVGAGSTVTNQMGYRANSNLTGATNNYGFYSDIASATNRWNFFANGTANNAFNGSTRFGGTTAPTVAVDVTGAVLATTSIRSSGQTAGVGYATGAGSTVTQGSGSGKATSVTLNRVCGQITMDSATLNAATAVSFTLNNTAIATTDVVIVNIDSGATTNSYSVTVEDVGANSCQIQLYNHSASNLSEAVVLNFAVIKSVTA